VPSASVPGSLLLGMLWGGDERGAGIQAPLAPHSLPASCAQPATNACEGAGHRWTAPEARFKMSASRQQVVL